MNPITPDFIQIPAPVLVAEMPASHKILFGYIYWYTKLALQKCTASNETLGKLAGMHKDSVSNALSSLKNAGFITIKYEGKPGDPRAKRVIDSRISYKRPFHQKMAGSNRGTLPLNNGTPATETPNKEEYINNKYKRDVNEKSGKTVDKPDVRGIPSPAKERIREALFGGGLHQLKLGG